MSVDLLTLNRYSELPINEDKQVIKKPKNRNFVAKYMQACGSGRHEAKKGMLAPRCRQKKEWKHDLRESLRDS